MGFVLFDIVLVPYHTLNACVWLPLLSIRFFEIFVWNYTSTCSLEKRDS